MNAKRHDMTNVPTAKTMGIITRTIGTMIQKTKVQMAPMRIAKGTIHHIPFSPQS